MAGEHLGGSAGKHHVAALAPRLGAYVDHIVGFEHHVLVVLHHYHGVALVAQLLERVNEPLVVALVQADAGLVEDVEHIHQLRPDLRGKADALAFAARERRRVAVERHVVEAHVEHEAKAAVNLLHYLLGHLPLGLGQMIMQVGHPLAQLRYVHRGELGNVLAVDAEVQRLAVEAVAVALGAHGARKELSGPLLGLVGRLVALLQLQVFHQSVVRQEVVARAHGLGLDGQALVGAVHNLVDGLVGHTGERRVERDAILLANGLHLPEYERVFVFAQRQNAALANRERRVGHHLLAVDDVDVAQALAAVAGALRRIEREVVGGRLHIRQPRVGIHERLAVVAQLAAFGVEHHQLVAALLEGELHRVAQAGLVFAGHAQAVHHQLYVVVAVAVELHAKGDFLHLAIDAHVHVALFAQLLKQVFVVALAVLHQRRKNVDFAAVVAVENEVENLVDRILHHLLARQVGVGVTHARKQQAQVVVDLGGGANGASRIFVDGLLPYRNHGVQTRDFVNVGALEHAQHVAGVGRKRLEVAPLPLGKNRVEGQRRLAAAAEPRDHREAVVRNVDVDIFQVVHSRAQHAHAVHLFVANFH